MIKIFSKLEGNTLLYIINRVEDINNRTDVIPIPEDNFLQLATLKMSKGKTFRPHRHKWKDNKHAQKCYYANIEQ